YVAACDFGGALETTGELARLLLQQVPAAGPLMPQLAAAGHLEPLRGPAVRLVLRHGVGPLFPQNRRAGRTSHPASLLCSRHRRYEAFAALGLVLPVRCGAS